MRIRVMGKCLKYRLVGFFFFSFSVFGSGPDCQRLTGALGAEVHELAWLILEQARVSSDPSQGYLADGLSEMIQTKRNTLEAKGMTAADMDRHLEGLIRELANLNSPVSEPLHLAPAESISSGEPTEAEQNRRLELAREFLFENAKPKRLAAWKRQGTNPWDGMLTEMLLDSAPGESSIDSYVFALVRSDLLEQESGIAATGRRARWLHGTDHSGLSINRLIVESLAESGSPAALLEYLEWIQVPPQANALGEILDRQDLHPVILEVFQKHPDWLHDSFSDDPTDPFLTAEWDQSSALLAGLLDLGLEMTPRRAEYLTWSGSIETRKLVIKSGYDFFAKTPAGSHFQHFLEEVDLLGIKNWLDAGLDIRGKKVLSLYLNEVLPRLHPSNASGGGWSHVTIMDPSYLFPQPLREIYLLLKNAGGD